VDVGLIGDDWLGLCCC